MAPQHSLNTLGIFHHIEPQNTQGMRYYFNGQWQFMLEDEADTIERSGRSVDRYGRPMTVQAYASTDCPNEWPAVPVPVVPLMEARPGAVEPWLRPIHSVVTVPRVDCPRRVKAHDGRLHMFKQGQHVTACGAKAHKEDIYGFHRFQPVYGHERACTRCKAEWLGQWSKRKTNEAKAMAKRHMREEKKKPCGNYVKVMRWTAEEKRKLKQYREAVSGISHHGKRVPERGSATDHRTVR